MEKPTFRKDVLENGITVVQEKHSVRSASIGVWVKVGSSAESPSVSGISHCIEHMVFKGTEKRSAFEIATALEALGGDLNAFTDREVTCYHATVLSEHLPVAVDVLSDLVLHPSFPIVELERERKVLLQELSMIQDNPEEWIHDVHFQTIWPKDAIGQPIIGNKKTLNSISRAQITKYFENHYRPENIVISVSGNVDFNAFVKLAREKFQTRDIQEPLPFGAKVPKYKAAKKHVNVDADQLHLLVGFEGVTFNDPYRFDALVMSYFLGGGMSSRLFQEVREKAGLAYTVDCDFIPYQHTGLFTIYVALAPRSVNECVAILKRELQKLVTEKLSAKDINFVKGQLRGTILLSSDQMDVRQESIARNQILFGRYVSVEEIIAEIDKVTPERIQELAARIFVPEKESIVTLGRNKPKRKMTVF